MKKNKLPSSVLVILKFFFGKAVSDDFIKEKLNWDKNNSVKKTAKFLAKKARIKVKKCYICCSSNSNKVCKFFGINYVQCIRCSLVYTNRILSQKALNEYYKKSKNYFSEAYTNKNNINLRNNLIKPKIKFVEKYAKGKQWLDVGAAEGTTVDLARKEGFQAEGIEISETSRKFAKKFRKIELLPYTLESFYSKNTKKWDVISFYGVIDVVSNPVEILHLARKMLSKKGIIVVQVPNYESGSTLVQKLITNPARHLKPPLNFKLFTLKSIKQLMKKTKFVPIVTWYSGMDMIEFIKYVRTLDTNFMDSGLDKFLIKNVNSFQQIFDDLSMSDMIVVIARKPN